MFSFFPISVMSRGILGAKVSGSICLKIELELSLVLGVF